LQGCSATGEPGGNFWAPRGDSQRPKLLLNGPVKYPLVWTKPFIGSEPLNVVASLRTPFLARKLIFPRRAVAYVYGQARGPFT
jgi:hypothetical protein